ncbi:TSK-associating protein 1 isoform X2 [Arabidopsis lyrata subsp. lyrata]|uniref:TSK-associating protein 1 isoform X2 n=1 Tax=Arabidopsis lyrata subsp. lyrata TaxID=81972 RepID=UPI000A29B19C|nr:TSK-associating protein 1 isoform X2 [Arabidopsis lyrata subsp. lyrata]|eukprot:XP_020867897.1 TSK-associating protein 1 isoform X2 [Arabidopsis lyrata subsp. lyrata]
MEISAMKTNFLALALSLCLLLSSFHEVSCQDDGSGLSNFDLIERDYQDSVNALQGKEDEDQSAKIQSENKNNTTVTDKNTISLSLSDETEVGSVSDESVKRSSLLDQIELEFEAHHNSLNQAGSDGVKAESKDDEELSAQRQKMLEEIEREFEAASSSLKQLKTDEINEGNDEEHSAKRQSLLDEIEREFEAATKELEQLKVNDFTIDKDDEEQSAKRKSMLEAIEREFEAAMEGIEELKVSDSTGSGDDEEQSAKRLSMLEEIEREFEAATKGLEQLKAGDSTGEKNEEEQAAKGQSLLEEIEREFEAATESLKLLQVDDSTEDTEQSAKRQSMLEEIEREFEAATKGLEQLKANDFTEGSDNEEQSAQRKSMLEEIEREFEAAIGGLKQIKVDDSRNIEEESAKRKIMLEEMEREFEEAHSGINGKADTEESAKKQSDYATPEVLGLGKPGVCSCFNQDNADLKHDDDASIVIPTKYSIEEILSEESAVQGTETSSLTASLTQLVENHRKEKESPLGHRVLTSSSSSSASSTSESSATSETVETLRAKLKELRGLTARELVTRQDFDQILITAASFEELSSAPISYISRLAKYRNVIKEGLEASERVHIAQARATMLKEVATEKQTAVDSHFATAKTLAQKGDALFVRIFAIKKLLAKLEAEKESIDGKFKETVKELSHFLVDASDAYEEYHGAVRKAKDEQAAEEFAKEATQSAEIIWVKFLSSL